VRLSIAPLEIEEKLVFNGWLGTPESHQDAIYVSIVLEIIYGDRYSLSLWSIVVEGISCWEPQVLFLPPKLSRPRNVGLSLALRHEAANNGLLVVPEYINLGTGEATKGLSPRAVHQRRNVNKSTHTLTGS